MKRFIIVLLATLWTASIRAQQIVVVSPYNNTTTHSTLQDAIEKATEGSVIYLPGGSFSISDENTINKRLTFVSVTHSIKSNHIDGATIIGGNLRFLKGSDGSAVIGPYVTGSIYIGTSNDTVRNVLVRNCNLNYLQVRNAACSGVMVNQCYLRSASNFGSANAHITNCICYSLSGVVGGVIDHNVINNGDASGTTSTISNNIIINGKASGDNCQIINNMCTSECGMNCLVVSDWAEVLTDYTHGISIYSDFSLKGETGKNAATDGTDIGIYGGSGFDKDAISPIPYVVAKRIPEQTDASGNLSVQMRVMTK